MNVATFHVAFRIALSLLLLQTCAASVPSCGDAPRMVGAFGAENNPAAPISIPANIRSQLPNVEAVRQVLNTQLSPSGEQVIIYDAASDESDPQPHVAFVIGEKVAKVLDGGEAAKAPGGFARYMSACQFDTAAHQKAVALAFSSAFDGSGSAFAVIMWHSGDYRVVSSLHGMQGQLVLRRGGLALWTSNGQGECVWCAQHYKIRHYVWRRGTYVRTGVTKLKRLYDPTVVSGTPLRLATEEH